MNRQNRRGLAFLLLGVALLANPLYAYPENVSSETTLTYEAEPTQTVPPGGTFEAAVRECGEWTSSRECAVAAALARGETLRVELPADASLDDERYRDYDFVRVGDRFYRPVERVEDGSLVVGLDPTDEATVVRAAAEEYEDARPFRRAAVENGSATVPEDEVYETGTKLVERDGTVYAVRPVDSDRSPTGWGWREPPRIVVEAIRLFGALGGVALVWRAGEWTERGR